METYLSHTYKISILVHKGNIETQNNFKRKSTPQTTETDIKARNSNSKNFNEAKENIRNMVSCPDHHYTFWTLAEPLNMNFTDISCTPLIADDCSMNYLFIKIFSSNFTRKGLGFKFNQIRITFNYSTRTKHMGLTGHLLDCFVHLTRALSNSCIDFYQWDCSMGIYCKSSYNCFSYCFSTIYAFRSIWFAVFICCFRILVTS